MHRFTSEFEKDQVVPVLYGRQANLYDYRYVLHHKAASTRQINKDKNKLTIFKNNKKKV